jgi:hypothetical protein
VYPKDLFSLREQSEARAAELPGRSRVEFDRLITSPDYSNCTFAATPELSIHSRDNEKPLQMIVSGHANRFDVLLRQEGPGATCWLAAGPCVSALHKILQYKQHALVSFVDFQIV